MTTLFLYSDWKDLSCLHPWKVTRSWGTAISKAGFTCTAFLQPAHRTSRALLQATHNSLGAFPALAWLFCLDGDPIETKPIQNWNFYLFQRDMAQASKPWHDLWGDGWEGAQTSYLPPWRAPLKYCDNSRWKHCRNMHKYCGTLPLDCNSSPAHFTLSFWNKT